MNLPEKVYTENDVARARRRGQWVGFVQGSAVMVGSALLLNVLGWIPAVLTVGAIGYGGYRVYRWLSKPTVDEES